MSTALIRHQEGIARRQAAKMQRDRAKLLEQIVNAGRGKNMAEEALLAKQARKAARIAKKEQAAEQFDREFEDQLNQSRMRAMAPAPSPIKKRATAAEKRAEKARMAAEKAKADEDARLAENAGKLVKQVMRITKKALDDGRITKTVKVRVNKCVKKIV
jgi:hypothetical protein